MATTTTITVNHSQLLHTAKQVISIEQQALARLIDSIDDNFIKACELLLACKGRIILTGIGKSGHIAHKLAASFASLGSPALFLHAGEALHGDLGMVTQDDVIIALSYSGTSNEILAILPSLNHQNIPIIAITGNAESHLAKASTIHLAIHIDQEACFLNLAPTASTTASLALGDALVMAVTKAKLFTPQDFAKRHPGGDLGRKLLLKVQDIMVKDDRMPVVAPDTSLSDCLFVMNSKGLGMIAIVDHDQKVLGIFTDGDLRRFLNNDTSSSQTLREIKIKSLMNNHCTIIEQHSLATVAWELMCAKKINGLLVTDYNGKLIGMLNIHSLINAKII